MRWWGDFELALGASWCWKIGPLSLYATRREHEWEVANRWSDDPFDDQFEVLREVEVPETLERRRYLLTANSGVLRLSPRVADRPVVARPEQPVIIPGGESARLYVASALFVELSVGIPGRLLTEVPAWRMSSTWFGENTLDGTLCYSTRSRAKLEPTARGPRVTTAVDIRNDHGAPLRVERLALSLPQMSVFVGADERLWTEVTRVTYDPANLTPATIGSHPPKLAGDCEQVSRPRQDRQQNLLARALTAAFKGVWGG